MLRAILCFLMIASPLFAQSKLETSAGAVQISPIATGLDEPWAVGFLPQGGILITERDGRLFLGKDGVLQSVSGVPKVWANGQGGLLDVVVARDFEQSREIFLSFSEPRGRGAGTALAVGKLDVTAAQLTDLRVIFRQKNATRQGRHFGSRIVEARDGTLFLTIGDRGTREEAQDLNLPGS